MVLYGERISLGTLLAFRYMSSLWLLFLFVPLDPKSINLHCINRPNTLNHFDLYFFQVNLGKKVFKPPCKLSKNRHSFSMTEKCTWISNSKEDEQREPLACFLGLPPLGLKIWSLDSSAQVCIEETSTSRKKKNPHQRWQKGITTWACSSQDKPTYQGPCHSFIWIKPEKKAGSESLKVNSESWT